MYVSTYLSIYGSVNTSNLNLIVCTYVYVRLDILLCSLTPGEDWVTRLKTRINTHSIVVCIILLHTFFCFSFYISIYVFGVFY